MRTKKPFKKPSWKDKIDPAFDKIIKIYIQFIEFVGLPANTGLEARSIIHIEMCIIETTVFTQSPDAVRYPGISQKNLFGVFTGRKHRDGHGWSEKESLADVGTGNSFLVDKQLGVLYAYDTDSAPISVFSVTGGRERTCQVTSMSMSFKTGQELP
jgi:hypothetical protein